MGRHYEEGSGGYRDDTYDDSYEAVNGASGDGSGDGNCKKNPLSNIYIKIRLTFIGPATSESPIGDTRADDTATAAPGSASSAQIAHLLPFTASAIALLATTLVMRRA